LLVETREDKERERSMSKGARRLGEEQEVLVCYCTISNQTRTRFHLFQKI
jgi:hypothetical protein